MITIRNLSKRTVVLNLPHATACNETDCTCDRVKVGVETHDPATGERGVRAVNKRIGASLTLFPKGYRGAKGEALDEVDDVLDSARNSPDVASALRRGEIEIVVAKAEPATAEPEQTDKAEKKAAPLRPSVAPQASK